MALDVEINAKGYSLLSDRDGAKVATRPVQQFVQPIRQTGRTRPEDVAPYETFIIPNLTKGFGRFRIDSDSAFNPEEYRRFFNSTCDTRWADSIYLPILAESSTQTGLERIRRSIHFKGQLFGAWSDASSTLISTYLYDGSDLTWDAAGQVAPQIRIDATTSNTNTSYAFNTTHTTGTDANRLMIVMLSTVGRVPTGITYDGDALTKVEEANNGNYYSSIWYRVAPATGSNTLVTTFGADSSADTAAELTVTTLFGVDQSSPVGTDVEQTGNDTAPSVDVTTTVGDLVFDVIAGDGDNESGGYVASSVPGTGQTELIDTVDLSSREVFHTVTHSYADRTTTTMSETLTITGASTAVWSHVAVGVKAVSTAGRVNVLFDMHVHEGKAFALYGEASDHYISMTSKIDNATDDWTVSNVTTPLTTGLLSNDITANEDMDGGLLTSIGGELVAALWHESNGTITFSSSGDSGVTWTDESIDIGSGNGPQGLVVYPDIDGVDKLYLGTAEGIWLIDTAPSTWTFDLLFPMSYSTDNGRDMEIHQGAIWFAQGVGNDSPAPIFRMTVQGDSRQIESGYGLNFGDGVPAEMHGPVRRMKSSGDFLYISVGGGAASRFARILCWNGGGWHHMTKHTTQNLPIEWIDVGSEDDDVSRLHFAVKTAASTSASAFLGYADTNPRSGVAIKREAYSDGNAGHIVLPYYDFGIPQEDKNFTSIHVIADDLNSSASDEYIDGTYGHNGAAVTSTTTGNFLSGTTKINLGSSAGQQAKNIGMRFNLRRGSTNTDTPKLRDIVVEGYVVPNIAYEHQMTIDIEESAIATGQSVETVIANLETLISTVTQVTFKFGQVSKYVAVDRERSSFSYSINAWEPSGASNALSERKGTFNLVLIEKAAS